MSGRKIAALIAGLGVLLAAGVWWRTNQAIKLSQQQISLESQIRFTLNPWNRTSSAGYEPVSAASAFLDAASYQGKLYVASSNALLEYSAEQGTPAKIFRCGLDLPPSPISALATGPALDGTGEWLYVATEGEGILIFDGQSFKHLRPELPALRSITALASTGVSGLLVGSKEAGIFRFDGQELNWLHPNLKDLKITALAGDMADLWIGTRDKGVGHFLAGQLTFTSEPQGLPDVQVLSLSASSDSTFVGTPNGVALFRGGKFERILAPGFFARSLAANAAGVWIGTLEEGVINVPLNGRASSIPIESEVRRIIQIGKKWIAVTRGGLYDLSTQRTELLVKAPGALLADANISALAFDSSSRLWVGYFDKGLDVIAADFQKATHVESSTIFCVNRILDEPDRQRTVVATANGLAIFDPNLHIRQTLLKHDGLIANHITDIASTATGLVLATPAGITFLDPQGARSIYGFQGLVNNHVYALSAVGNQLLAGTLGGLSVLEKDIVKTNLTTANSNLKHNWITAIAAFGNQHYIGTYGVGVVKLNPSLQVETFPDMAKEIIVNPNAMLATANALYVGTLGHGFGVFNWKQQRWRFVENGLPSLNVTAFIARAGYLYIGTENGLIRVPEKNLEF